MIQAVQRSMKSGAAPSYPASPPLNSSRCGRGRRRLEKTAPLRRLLLAA